MSASSSVDECVAEILGQLTPSHAYRHLLLESLGLAADRDVTSPRAVPDDGIAKDAVVIAAGSLVGPRDVGLLAGLGVDQVSVVPRPRVVVISSGAELVEPGRAPGAGQYDANSYLLAAAVRAAGGIAYRVQVPTNDPATFAQVVDDQLVRADLVVTTGGKADVARAALGRGQGIGFREVAMWPGPSLGFGFLGPERTPLFALPADPVAAYVSFVVFVAPALRRLSGHKPEQRPLFRARLTQDVRSAAGVRHYVGGVFASDAEGASVRPIGADRSLSALAEANAFIVLREDVDYAKAGDPVPIMLLDRDY